MDPKAKRPESHAYEPEAWKGDDELFGSEKVRPLNGAADPNVKEQCRVLELLGKINYRILTGNRVYIEVGGTVYRTLYGGYWRSVFTGIEHYLLRCEQVSDGAWSNNSSAVDLPIAYSKDGWTASGHSLSFIINRDSNEIPQKLIDRFRRTKSNAMQKVPFRGFDMFCA